MTDTVELQVLDRCLEWERAAQELLDQAAAGRAFLKAIKSPLHEAVAIPNLPTEPGKKKQLVAVTPTLQELPRATQKSQRIARDGTWTGVILAFVETQELGAPYSKIREHVLTTPLGAKLLQTDKSFYGALKKLEDAGTLVRKAGWAYTLPALERVKALIERGEMADFPVEKFSGESPLETAIIRFLATRNGFTASRTIIDHLIHLRAEFSERVSNNNSNAYNVLTRLVTRGVLLKDEDAKTYKLSQQHIETESGSPMGEPVRSEDSHSSLNGSSLHTNGTML